MTHYPQLRLGQLIENMLGCLVNDDLDSVCIFNMDDGEQIRVALDEEMFRIDAAKSAEEERWRNSKNT